MVVPSSANSLMRSQNCRLASGSKPVVGSSRNSSSGMAMMPSATSSRRRCPPDSVRTLEPDDGAEPDEFEQLLRTRACAVAFGEHAHGLGHGEHPEVAGLLQHDADLGAPAPPRGPGILTEDAHLPGVAFAVALEDLDGRRLARPVGTEDREDLAVADVEIQIAHRVQTRRRTSTDRARAPRRLSACVIRPGSGSAARLEFGEQSPQFVIGQRVHQPVDVVVVVGGLGRLVGDRGAVAVESSGARRALGRPAS